MVEFPAALAQPAGVSAYLRERDPRAAARVAASIEAAAILAVVHSAQQRPFSDA